ncbi:copper resistance protein B [Sphingomonas lacusdianchii]|uniref:copper resistance protein B n=1 Tax=Sphingomonas lacusdianchii TaxID=2917992 RepID=UPI001F5AB02E|nr:copper resistance protein B [Sphingomonas sp. JXJ CY 53]
MTCTLAALLALSIAAPAVAQDHSHMDHAQMGHAPPAQPAAPAASAPAATPDPAEPTGTDQSPGSAPPPPVPMPHYADRVWGGDVMARSRDAMMAEEGGGQRFAQLLLDRVEWKDGGYAWEGEGWFGGDIHRLVVKSEGEGGDRVEGAEVQALYSRAIDPYFNLQTGIRQDIRPTPARTYLTVGVEGLAPYWFEVNAAAFLSTRGELLGRIEGYYDQRITQRLILQPRAELNLSAQNIRETGTGSGLTNAELGLRLRYEIAREFAPYVGVNWERRFGDTRRFGWAAGEDSGGIGLVAGIRAWF